MSFERILFQLDGGIARITLNRPERRNALESALIAELTLAFDEAARSDARVILLAGAGRDFCSGADLAEVRRSIDAGVLASAEDARHLANLFLAMRRHPLPIVASVRGRALAGGCGLATACDVILAAETAEFGYPEVQIGFVPAMVMAILRRSVSEKRAFEWITTGRRIPAAEAQTAGLVHSLHPEEELDVVADAFAKQMAARSASAVSLTKSLLYHMDGMSFETALDAGVQMNAIARMTDDCRNGIDRFFKKST